MSRKFDNPSNYGYDPETTKEELFEYINKLEDKVRRRNLQIKNLKKKINELESENDDLKEEIQDHEKFSVELKQ